MIGKGYVYRGSKISPSQFLMMVLLRHGPMYGYELLKTMREEFVGLWEPQTGAFYPALKKLEGHKLVKVETRDGKDYYMLTQDGEKWMWETIETISRDVRFLSRYVEILSQAAMERVKPIDGAEEINNGSLPWQLLHLVDDLDIPTVRLSTMRMVKGMLESKVKDLEREISRLEEEAV
jgi:DNA-binding PadR family transcriptional regulator